MSYFMNSDEMCSDENQANGKADINSAEIKTRNIEKTKIIKKVIT